MTNKRIILYVLWLVLGAVLIGLACAEIVDEFWSGMGAGLLVVGAVRLLQMYRFRKNEEYREKVEVEISDERNRFLRNKAWAWAGYLFILIAAVSVIVLQIAGQREYSQAASYAICLMMLLYWVSFLVLRKKY